MTAILDTNAPVPLLKQLMSTGTVVTTLPRGDARRRADLMAMARAGQESAPRVEGTAGGPRYPRVATLSYLSSVSCGALLRASGTPSNPGPHQPSGISVSVTCFGSGAVDVMCEYRVVPR